MASNVAEQNTNHGNSYGEYIIFPYEFWYFKYPHMNVWSIQAGKRRMNCFVKHRYPRPKTSKHLTFKLMTSAKPRVLLCLGETLYLGWSNGAWEGVCGMRASIKAPMNFCLEKGNVRFAWWPGRKQCTKSQKSLRDFWQTHSFFPNFGWFLGSQSGKPNALFGYPCCCQNNLTILFFGAKKTSCKKPTRFLRFFGQPRARPWLRWEKILGRFFSKNPGSLPGAFFFNPFWKKTHETIFPRFFFRSVATRQWYKSVAIFFSNKLCEYVPLVDPGRSWKGSLMRFHSDLSFWYMSKTTTFWNHESQEILEGLLEPFFTKVIQLGFILNVCGRFFSSTNSWKLKMSVFFFRCYLEKSQARKPPGISAKTLVNDGDLQLSTTSTLNWWVDPGFLKHRRYVCFAGSELGWKIDLPGLGRWSYRTTAR